AAPAAAGRAAAPARSASSARRARGAYRAETAATSAREEQEARRRVAAWASPRRRAPPQPRERQARAAPMRGARPRLQGFGGEKRHCKLQIANCKLKIWEPLPCPYN